jgi:hypothetical protein
LIVPVSDTPHGLARLRTRGEHVSPCLMETVVMGKDSIEGRHVNDNFSAMIKKQVADARRKGLKTPVLLCLAPGSGPAEEIHQEICGRGLERPTNASGEVFVTTLACSVDEAVRVLRGHAGLGGRLMANLLESPPLEVDAWWLMFDDLEVTAIAIRRGVHIGNSYTPYGNLPNIKLCSNCARRKKQVPLVVPIDGDLKLYVNAENGTCAKGTLTFLAMVVANRRVPVPMIRQSMELPVCDGELASILALYSDCPQVVAEVARALERGKHPGRIWLMETLRSVPGLKSLAEQVEQLISAHVSDVTHKHRLIPK